MAKAKAKAKSTKAAKPSVSSADKPRTKSQILTDVATMAGVSRKEVTAVLGGIEELIRKDLSKKGPGIFTLPGLVKIKTVHKPATKARKGINPFTGEETMFKAKPARRVVKVAALKNLKTMI